MAHDDKSDCSRRPIQTLCRLYLLAISYSSDTPKTAQVRQPGTFKHMPTSDLSNVEFFSRFLTDSWVVVSAKIEVRPSFASQVPRPCMVPACQSAWLHCGSPDIASACQPA